jgi:mannose-6-phosphate isomerase class I
MFDSTRPYLVIPKLIQQKTWGGEYIVDLKKIDKVKAIEVPVGQSYELFSGTKLALKNESQLYEVGLADSDEIVGSNFETNNLECIALNDLITGQPNEVLGGKLSTDVVMPLLLKLTQAKGNSFQIHVKPDIIDSRWQSKSETWYFFEKGKVSCGIQTGISIEDYKQACKLIELEMKKLSEAVSRTSMLVAEAREKAKQMVAEINPWQFVRVLDTSEGEVFDMSRGGIHHSWEEDESNPRGNILYEVQQDRMDPISTIRSFDQGKISDSGMVREINIDDYFKYLDTDKEINNGKSSGVSRGGNNVFTTKDYAMDEIVVDKNTLDETNNSFAHYFVRIGEIKVETDGGEVVIKQGWSCFVPARVASKVHIKLISQKAVLLKTYVPEN